MTEQILSMQVLPNVLLSSGGQSHFRRQPMNISKLDFDRAAGQVSLTDAQAQELWRLLQIVPSANQPGGTRRFDVANVAYYFGALIIMGAMGWFMTSAWEAFGGAGIFLIAAAYLLAFAAVGGLLWRRSAGGLRNLGGLLVTVAVAMTPLTVYGLQRWTGAWTLADPGSYAGFHEWIKGGWVWMELGTVLAGVIALWFVRFPFLTAPIAFALWYMSMDLTPVLFGTGDAGFTWTQYLRVSLGFGVLMLGIAYAVDVYRQWQKPDYGFWLSFFGLLAFWGGLNLLHGGNEHTALLYAVINVVLIFLGVVLDRRAFVVFGALGVNGYLGHLAWDVFSQSALFPFVLSAFGICVIVCGVIYARHCAAWRAFVLDMLPPACLRLVPGTARPQRQSGTA